MSADARLQRDETEKDERCGRGGCEGAPTVIATGQSATPGEHDGYEQWWRSEQHARDQELREMTHTERLDVLSFVELERDVVPVVLRAPDPDRQGDRHREQ